MEYIKNYQWTDEQKQMRKQISNQIKELNEEIIKIKFNGSTSEYYDFCVKNKIFEGDYDDDRAQIQHGMSMDEILSYQKNYYQSKFNFTL